MKERKTKPLYGTTLEKGEKLSPKSSFGSSEGYLKQQDPLLAIATLGPSYSKEKNML